ncbi:toxin-antitoxin system YwqK family antitoxin [Wenyingzhuangia sp. IMCC45467]
MKYIKTLLLALCCVCCKPSTTSTKIAFDLVVNFNDLTKNPKNGHIMYDTILFTGIAKEFKTNDKTLKYLVTYQNGLKNGLCKKWYDNGVLNYETSYVKGRKQGLTKIWFKNGQLQSEATYYKGVIHGEAKVWYPTGEIQKERNLEYGQEVGLQKAWRKNGKLYANYEAVNGRIFGLLGSNMCYEVENEKIKK